MTLLSIIDAELAFGMTPLLDMAALTVVEGERIGFIGRNGSGKSSLLAAIAGRIALDAGEVRPREGLRTVLVEQEPQLPPAPTLRASLVLRGAPRYASPLALADRGLRHGTQAGRQHVAELEPDHWREGARLEEYLHRFDLDGDIDPAGCSGGERKRAALALALAQEPDLLLLDEPTNHLDLDGIEKLEALLVEQQRGQRAAIVITHDRRFLDRVATRIVELDRGVLRSFPGNFAAYESRKSLELQSEALGRRRFDRFWLQEEAWIRKGIEARRTRNQGRVRRLEQLRTQREARRERLGSVALNLATGDRSGRLVAEMEGVSKRFGDRLIVADLSLRLLRGDRLALIGANGAGKTTLIKLITGQLAPDTGTVRAGTHLEVAVFDQQRAALDPDRTLIETISPGSDWIEIGSSRKHVLAYLGDFLFPPRRAEAPVRTLSGGERNRLLLARLFARPANLLVLDEPTNDLDMETLELLEATLSDYEGTLLLVSHDRRFLDNLATQCLVARGSGRWQEYVGGYSDWERQRDAVSGGSAAPEPGLPPGTRPPAADARQSARRRAAPRAGTANQAGRAANKLGFAQKRELAALPDEIAALEQEQAALHARMAQSEYHRQGPVQLREDRARAAVIEQLLEEKLARWVDLDARGPG